MYLSQRTARTALAEEEIMTTRDATKMKVVAVVEARDAAQVENSVVGGVLNMLLMVAPAEVAVVAAAAEVIVELLITLETGTMEAALMLLQTAMNLMNYCFET